MGNRGAIEVKEVDELAKLPKQTKSREKKQTKNQERKPINIRKGLNK